MRKQTLKRIEKLEQELAQREEARKAITRPRMKVDKKVLDHELMRLVVELDPEKHPAMKLKALEAAYVVNGTLESNGTRRLNPPDAGGPNVYQSLFQRGIFDNTPPDDLYPPAEQKPAPVNSAPPLPPLGESIDKAPMPDKSESPIFTVHVDGFAKTLRNRPQ